MDAEKRHIIFPIPQVLTAAALLLLLFISGSSYAQKASASLDTNRYRIGEWIPLHLELQIPAGKDYLWPLIDAEVEGLEVLKRTELDSTATDDRRTIRQTLTLTAFDSGYYPVPAFHFIVGSDTVSTTPMLLHIATVEIDTAEADIKPIKGPIKAPVTLREMLPYILGGLGLIALCVLAWLYWRQRSRTVVEPEVPVITVPAHEWARAELRALEQEGLWQKGEVKEYYIRLTDILRRYIELRFDQPAMESTTDEIMQRLRRLSLEPGTMEKVRSTLVLSDLVKFAKAKPMADEHEQSFAVVSDFVDKTELRTDEKPETP